MIDGVDEERWAQQPPYIPTLTWASNKSSYERVPCNAVVSSSGFYLFRTISTGGGLKSRRSSMLSSWAMSLPAHQGHRRSQSRLVFSPQPRIKRCLQWEKRGTSPISLETNWWLKSGCFSDCLPSVRVPMVKWWWSIVVGSFARVICRKSVSVKWSI